mmetsp:Transcript_9108/g.13283  ORF Transcript_9108/g.13283 Transcript_9108/m.13283 type:complete len:92 (+) Transcript_9108:168-443(+)
MITRPHRDLARIGKHAEASCGAKKEWVPFVSGTDERHPWGRPERARNVCFATTEVPQSLLLCEKKISQPTGQDTFAAFQGSIEESLCRLWW